ncbi:Carbohydrate kinase PfkB domain-containing protein [Plasmodiophora brassicae]
MISRAPKSSIRTVWPDGRLRQRSAEEDPALGTLQLRSLADCGLMPSAGGSLWQYSREVADAIAANRPVVALESTIISHGMPYPENVQTAHQVEECIREGGAVPATIAILDGVIRIGLTRGELERIARIGREMVKVSRRDLAFVCASKLNGSTTVSATMICAYHAGISVFCTGGIGGVHRGVQDTMDVSADLTELGRTRVAVVCAGVKSILDIGRTLEFLETEGVPVVTLGADEFPAFFTANSGFKTPMRLDTVQQCANLIRHNETLGLSNGAVIAVPIPTTSSALGAQVEGATQQALQEAVKRGITGRHITPFLLQRIAELTQGASLRANVELIKNNAKHSAAIAKALAGQSPSHEGAPSVLVVGGCALDVLALTPAMIPKTSNPGQVHHSYGGVARNIAECCARLGQRVAIATAVGNDVVGKQILGELESLNVDTSSCVTVEGARTASYVAVHGDDGGDLSLAIADFAVIEAHFATQEMLPTLRRRVESVDVSFVVLDGNLSARVLSSLIEHAFVSGKRVWFEPISIAKSNRFVGVLVHRPDMFRRYSSLIYLSANTLEAMAMATALRSKVFHKPGPSSLEDAIETLTISGIGHLVVMCGAEGALVCSGTKQVIEKINAQYVDPNDIVNTNGAGDCLVASTITGLTRGLDLGDAVRRAMPIAALTVQSRKSVSEKINPSLLTNTGLPRARL